MGRSVFHVAPQGIGRLRLLDEGTLGIGPRGSPGIVSGRDRAARAARVRFGNPRLQFLVLSLNRLQGCSSLNDIYVKAIRDFTGLLKPSHHLLEPLLGLLRKPEGTLCRGHLCASAQVAKLQ